MVYGNAGEGLLRRILHWIQHELFWECREKASETWVSELPHTEGNDGSSPSTLWKFKQNKEGMLSIRAEALVTFK
jgi:hypothetical protein